MTEIQYDDELDRFFIRCAELTPHISEWLGWRRVTGNGHLYMARAWASSVLSVKPQPGETLRWSESATRKRDELIAALQRARNYLASKDRLELRRGCPTERDPRHHQRQAIHAMREMEWRCLLSDKMGLGKTSSALWALHDSRATRALVICPVSVKFNWQREVELTLGEGWNAIVIDGTSKQRANQFAELKNSCQRGNTVGIINYDLLLHITPEQTSQLNDMLTFGGMMLLDESHYLKSVKSQRTGLVTGLSRFAKQVIALTGTPIRNLADDVYSQAEIVRPGLWSSARDFTRRHLVIQSVKFGKRDVQKVVGVKNLDQLNAALNTFVISRRKEDVIDLPPKVHTYPDLELDGVHRKLYDAMKKFAKLELHAFWSRHSEQEESYGMPATVPSIWDPRAKSGVEAALRCEQIAQGFVGGIPDPVMNQLSKDVLNAAEKIEGRPNELIFPSSPKLVWLLETIESITKEGGAPLVLSRFNAPMFWLAKVLSGMGIRSVVLHGGLSATGKADVVGAFQDKETDVLIAQVKMAEGWNATRSQDVIFLGRDWSPAINEQAEDRAHRIGTKGTVNVQIPIVRKTIEVMIDQRLADKSSDAQQALKTVTVAQLIEAL